MEASSGARLGVSQVQLLFTATLGVLQQFMFSCCWICLLNGCIACWMVLMCADAGGWGGACADRSEDTCATNFMMRTPACGLVPGPRSPSRPSAQRWRESPSTHRSRKRRHCSWPAHRPCKPQQPSATLVLTSNRTDCQRADPLGISMQLPVWCPSSSCLLAIAGLYAC